MKTLSFICLFLFLNLFSFGQSLLPSQKACIPPVVESKAVVKYKTSADVELKLVGSKEYPKNFVLKNAETKATLGDMTLTQNVLAFNRLPLNQDFIVEAQNSCGQVVTIGGFTTKSEGKQSILMNESFYNHLTKWQIENGYEKISLEDYVKQLPSVSWVEKVSFLQRFFLADEPIDDKHSQKGAFPNFAKSSACICNELQVNSGLTRPFGAIINQQNGTGYEIKDMFPSFNMNQYTDNPFLGSYGDWYSWAERGPAIIRHIEQTGNNSGRHTIEHANYGSLNTRDGQVLPNTSPLVNDNQALEPSKNPNTARIRLTLLCNNGNQCPCSREVSIDALLDGHIKCNASTRAGGFGNRNGNVQTELYALLSVYNERTSNLDILQTGRMAAEAYTDQAIAGASYQSRQGTTVLDGALIDKQAFVRLTSDAPIDIDLSVYRYSKLTGTTGWLGITDYYTNYALSVVTYPTTPIELLDCCNSYMAAWSTADRSYSSSPNIPYRLRVSSHLGGITTHPWSGLERAFGGGPTITHNLGMVTQDRERPGFPCVTNVLSSDLVKENNIRCKGMRTIENDNDLWVQKSYFVYNTLGQELFKGQVNKGLTELFTEEDYNKLPNGVYVVAVPDAKFSYKFIKY